MTSLHQFHHLARRAMAVSAALIVLAGCGGGGGGGGDGGGMTPDPMTPDPITRTFTTGTPTAAERTGAGGNDVWTIAGNATDNDPTTGLNINGVINGAGGDEDEIRLLGEAAVTETAYPDVFAVCAPADAMCADAVVASVSFSDQAPTGGAVHLQNIEIITLDGGTVNGAIDASAATAGITFNLISGRVSPMDPAPDFVAITGSDQNDVFIIAGDITGDSPALALNGLIQGGDGDADEFRLVAGGIVNSITYLDTARENISLQNIEHITIAGGTANGLIDARSANTGITFNLTSGEARFGILGSGHNDIFNLNPGSDITITGGLLGDAGADTFNLESGTITGDVNGGEGADSFVIGAGITIGGTIDGGLGMDTLSLASGFTLASANLFNDMLTLTLTGGGSLDLTLANIETIDISGLTTMALPLTFPAATAGADTFSISTDITDSNQRQLDIVIDGAGGQDELQLNTDAVVAGVAFSDQAPTGAAAGAVHLQNVETITLNGGMVTTGLIDASGAPANPAAGMMTPAGVIIPTGVRFNLIAGTAGSGAITGSPHNDLFIIAGDKVGASRALTINGSILADAGDQDEVRVGNGGNVERLHFGSLTLAADDLSVRAIEVITIDGGIVNNDIIATDAPASVTFNLVSGRVGPTAFVANSATNIIIGSGSNDIFIVSGDITDPDMLDINGVINGGGGTADEVRLIASGVVDRMNHGFFAVGELNLRNVEVITINGGTVNNEINFGNSGAPAITFNLIAGVVGGNITGAGHRDDIFIISGDITGDNPALDLNGLIGGGTFPNPGPGGGTADEVRLVANGVVNSLDFGSFAAGDLSLRDIETITIDGGMADGIVASTAPAAVTFNLTSGTILGSVLGSNHGDIFNLRGTITINSTVTGGNGVDTFNIDSGTLTGNVNGGAGDDVIILSGDATGNDPALDINIVFDGAGGDDDVLELNTGATVAGVSFNAAAPTGGAVHLQNVETITIDGGRVNGNITATGADASITFNLRAGTISGSVLGSPQNDTFNLYDAIRIGSTLFGGNGTDVLRYAGASGFDSPARGGLAEDTNIRDELGDVRQIESQEADANINSIGVGAGLRGLTVRGIEVLGLSPALNLYGAMSDALMQFGQQTAQGFALADLDLSTGRATSLVSKDSPFTKGRIWAHKITHSGNGKGSIGLGLTGLTARADSDYDYEMSLTQHGFDAPLAATKLGAFNLRAVSHTMTGTIETNVAEAQVSGYGAGVALLWRGGAAASKASASATRVGAHHHGLSAHITSLAGAYEVEAHTSPLNPRAVVNEVSEGSFSAINAVVSVGVADTRKLGHSLVLRTTADIVWQTLSLDDFSETGQDGIIINFDKATRFTARVGAGLEGEHWFSDVAFVHETSSGGTLSSGLRQDYKQDDGTAIEMKLGGKLADLATGLTLKAYAGLRTSLISSDAIDPSAHLALNWRF